MFPSSQVSPIVLIEFPHTSAQTLGVESPPRLHIHPFTGPLQSDLHPYVPITFPSSQISPWTLLPSPHIAKQDDGDGLLLHVHPVSKVQRELQPSRLTKLLSSHCSLVVMMPSPQVSVHVLGFVMLPPVHW